jgi:hypothetical protein
MLRCDCDDPADLLTGRTAPESSDRLVLSADAVVVVVAVAVAGPDTDTVAVDDAPRFPDDDDRPFLDLRLNQHRQLMSAAPAPHTPGARHELQDRAASRAAVTHTTRARRRACRADVPPLGESEAAMPLVRRDVGAEKRRQCERRKDGGAELWGGAAGEEESARQDSKAEQKGGHGPRLVLELGGRAGGRGGVFSAGSSRPVAGQRGVDGSRVGGVTRPDGDGSPPCRTRRAQLQRRLCRSGIVAVCHS